MDTPELFGGDSDLSDLEEDPGVDAEMDDVEVDDAADPTIERGEDDDDDEWVGEWADFGCGDL